MFESQNCDQETTFSWQMCWMLSTSSHEVFILEVWFLLSDLYTFEIQFRYIACDDWPPSWWQLSTQNLLEWDIWWRDGHTTCASFLNGLSKEVCFATAHVNTSAVNMAHINCQECLQVAWHAFTDCIWEIAQVYFSSWQEVCSTFSRWREVCLRYITLRLATNAAGRNREAPILHHKQSNVETYRPWTSFLIFCSLWCPVYGRWRTLSWRM